MQLDPNILPWFIPLPPLLSFFVIVLFTNRSKGLSHWVAIASMATSWVMSWFIFFKAIGIEHFGETVFGTNVDWLPFGSEAIAGTETLKMGVLVDPLTAIMLFFVPLACLLIFIYSVGYHNWGKKLDPHDAHNLGSPAHHGIEPLYSRFFAYLSLFACGMLILVVADNLLLMFVGWEIMGFCSYSLIGFWYSRDYPDPKKITPRFAAIKAFMTTRVADVVMLIGIAYLYFAAGTLSFREIMFEGDKLQKLVEMASPIVGLSAAGLIGICLVIGTIGKSAQFPLHVWLPDAMEGPTPVSAMIHAATMVSAGIYAIIRMYPLLSAGSHVEGEAHIIMTAPMWLMAISGAITALMGATIGVTQNDVKKVLAYSTISQLGFMMAVLGIGGYIAAAFHLVTHAFFKALLFMGSGSIIHGVEHGMHDSHEDIDPQDMRYMGGLRTRMPWTFWTFVIGGAALAGFPFITAGFWSKDEILADALAHQPWLFVILAFSAFLTAFYTTRQIWMVFFGKPRTKAAEHAHENSWPMVLPLVVLAFFAITAGWVGIPEQFPVIGGLLPNWFHEFVGGTLVEHPEALPFNWVPLLTSLVVGLGGIVLGWLVYRNAYKTAEDKDPMMVLGGLYTFVQNKYKFDELYLAVFVKPTLWLGEKFFSAFLDKGLIDGILHAIANISMWLGKAFRTGFEEPVITGGADMIANAFKWVGLEGRVIQTGKIQQYLVVLLAIPIVAAAVMLLFGSGLR